MDHLKEPTNSNRTLQAKHKSTMEENSKLNFELDLKFKELNLLEQKSYLCYIEILGIPDKDNENCVAIVEQIASKLGLKLSVVKAFRIFSKVINKPRKIVAELLSYNQKQDLIKSVKQKQLNSKHLNNTWPYYQIYINNFFTEYNKYLFDLCQSFAKENGFRYVWYSKCDIFIRKDNNSEEFLIKDESDLLNIK